MHTIFVKSKLKLFLLPLIILFSCEDDEIVEIKKPEITVISPHTGPYSSDKPVDITIVVTSETELKAYSYEIINNLWPGYYSKHSGVLTGTSDTIKATFSYNTTTEKHFGLHVNASDINDEKAEKVVTGFTVRGY
ncbi:hypothetical protein LVD17_01645 [Fulvivirga ulvae]|uniref:hypothetical protein n=1 Tax=Fulvivirga ulvae TaxID=2904245 RepID=UPI001F3E6E70|nr:hypothetical protein [Fulvivirga ulvae]UII32542.1 hypothetical protein LVD17_01645 [Fulvivirga ulvae]